MCDKMYLYNSEHSLLSFIQQLGTTNIIVLSIHCKFQYPSCTCVEFWGNTQSLWTQRYCLPTQQYALSQTQTATQSNTTSLTIFRSFNCTTVSPRPKTSLFSFSIIPAQKSVGHVLKKLTSTEALPLRLCQLAHCVQGPALLPRQGGLSLRGWCHPAAMEPAGSTGGVTPHQLGGTTPRGQGHLGGVAALEPVCSGRADRGPTEVPHWKESVCLLPSAPSDPRASGPDLMTEE